MAKSSTESQEQQRLVLKLRWLHPDIIFFAIPNGGKRNKSEARTMVLEGVEKGIPDLFIAEPMGEFKGLFLELKRAAKSESAVSKEQSEKLRILHKKGYQTAVCYGEKDAYFTILKYLGINN